jgi:hypothetical protein
MKLDQDGRWIDYPVTNTSLANASHIDVSNMPPALPSEWIKLADRLPKQSDALVPIADETSDGPAKNRPTIIDTRYADIKETNYVD